MYFTEKKMLRKLCPLSSYMPRFYFSEFKPIEWKTIIDICKYLKLCFVYLMDYFHFPFQHTIQVITILAFSSLTIFYASVNKRRDFVKINTIEYSLFKHPLSEILCSQKLPFGIHTTFGQQKLL